MNSSSSSESDPYQQSCGLLDGHGSITWPGSITLLPPGEGAAQRRMRGDRPGLPHPLPACTPSPNAVKASGSSKLTHKKQLLRRWGKQVGAECSALLRKPFVLYDHPN